MKNNKLIGSAPSLERLNQLLENYFYSAITLKPSNVENQWTVHNSSKQIEGCIVVKQKNRYRFEMIA